MSSHLPLELWSAFVTLLVTIGPIDTAAVFTRLTKGAHRNHRKSLAARAVIIAGARLLIFAAADKAQ
jgi:multiple antibiotic resistance protein